jgi:6-phosphogluconolactonase
MTGAPKSNAVYGYYIDESMGTLLPFQSGPFASGSSPGFIAISPDSSFAYVLTGDNTVWVYAIDATTGALSPVATNPVAVRAVQITVNPDGSVAYIPVLPNGIFGFSINRSTGEFTPVPGSPFTTGSDPFAVTLNPAGTFAYVAANGAAQIDAYSVDKTTGGLAPIAGSPFSGGYASLGSLFVDPTGRFLYEGSGLNSNSISAFSIDSGTGVLTPITGSPFPTGANVLETCFEPTGRFLYAINTELFSVDIGVKNVFAYVVNATTGAVTQLTDYQFWFSSGPSIGACTVDPSGKFLYFVGDSGFSIDGTTGALSLFFPIWPDFATGMRFMAIASLN